MGALNAGVGDDSQLYAEADDDGQADASPPTMAQAYDPPAAPSELATHYIAHFHSGKTKPLTDFSEEGDGWVLFGVTGGHIKYPKSLVQYFEPTVDSIGAIRKWTDSAGSHHATAKFVGIDGDKVILTKDDGKTIHVPIDKLSDADQDLARRLHELIARQ